MVSLVVPTVNDDPVGVAVNWPQPLPARPHVTTVVVTVDAVAQFTRTEVAVASVRYGFLVNAAVAPAGVTRTPSENTADATQQANRRNAISAPEHRGVSLTRKTGRRDSSNETGRATTPRSATNPVRRSSTLRSL
jgi:hypothetical protein